MTARRRAERIALYVTIVFVCLVIVFPLYWLVINALIPGREVFRYPPAFFPTSFRLDAYREIIELHPILTWLKNSIVVSAGTVGLGSGSRNHGRLRPQPPRLARAQPAGNRDC